MSKCDNINLLYILMHSTHVFKKEKKNLNTMTLGFGVMFTGHSNWYYSLIL